jgi:hypothetical protein
MGHVGQRLGRNSMVDPDDPIEKWIVIAAIVLLVLAALGVDMLIRHDVSAASTETSDQAATVPPK